MDRAMPPELILFNIGPETREFLLVVGKYNGAVVAGFRQPCVALLSQWQSNWANLPPFNRATLIELVISRTPPISTATYGATREMQHAAEMSASLNSNVEALGSIAADPNMRSKTIVSNRGVYELAQERYCSRNDFLLRQLYLAKFQPCPPISNTKALSDFCCPPERASSGVMLPHHLGAKNPLEWELMSDDEKARVLFADSERWLNRSTPGPAGSSGALIGIPEVSSGSSNDWKGQPTLTREEIDELRSDLWKRF